MECGPTRALRSQLHRASSPPANSPLCTSKSRRASRYANILPAGGDFLERSEKSFYKLLLRTRFCPLRSSPLGCPPVISYRRPSIGRTKDDFPRQFQVLQTAQGRQQDLRLLQP